MTELKDIDRQSQPQTVLVVDPYASVRNLLERILQRYHYRVLTTDCAQFALNLLIAQKEPVDLVLVDLDSAGDLQTQLHAKRWPGRVLFTTAWGWGGEPAVDPSQMILKPFTMQNLITRVRQALATRERTATPFRFGRSNQGRSWRRTL